MDCNVRYMSFHGGSGRWIVVLVKLPAEPSRHRVAVWRELRKVGAVQLGQGCWALPDAAPFAGFVERMVDMVGEHTGEVLALSASAIDAATAARIRDMYDEARRAEWVEFESECGKCIVEIDKEIRTEKFTLAELDEEEQNVERLRRWHRELRTRDVFNAVEDTDAKPKLDACTAALERFTGLVYRAVGLD